MPIFVQGAKASQDAIGLPIALQEWSEYDGETAAVGRRLDTGHEGEVVAVVLTTKDRHARNPNRRPLEQWRRGFNALNREFRLEAGGVVFFKNCRPINTGLYVSTWPNILACNDQESAAVCKAAHAVMRVVVPDRTRESTRSGQTSTRFGAESTSKSRVGSSTERAAWGDVLIFYPEAAVQCGTEAQVRSEALRLANLSSLREPSFLIRGMNAAGEVVSAQEVAIGRVRYVDNGEEKYALPDADDLANLAQAYAGAIGKLSAKIAGFSLLPVDRLLLSPKTFFSPRRTAATVGVSQAFRRQDSGQAVYVAKEVFLKLSESEEALYVNAIHVVHPYSGGLNPDLFGGLTYARNAVLEPMRVQVGAAARDGSLSGDLQGPDHVSRPIERGSTPGERGQSSRAALSTRDRGAEPDDSSASQLAPDDPFAGIPSVHTRMPRLRP
jgi:hypothetical protein